MLRLCVQGMRQLRLTRKPSLLAAAAEAAASASQALQPSTIEEVGEGTLLPGFVASVTGDAVFVR